MTRRGQYRICSAAARAATYHRSVATYGQFCPVAKASDVFCQRWTPLIVRELLCGSRRFNEIQRGVPQVSPTLLSQRLKELERAGVVERRPDGYDLTAAGMELYGIVQALGEWGQRWARSDYSRDELDPGLLLWDLHRFVDPSGLRDGRTVVEFRFRRESAGRRHYWLVAAEGEVDVCLVDPGYEVDLVVDAELAALTRIWMGDTTWSVEQAEGRVEVLGPSRLARALPSWIGQHPVLASVAPAR